MLRLSIGAVVRGKAGTTILPQLSTRPGILPVAPAWSGIFPVAPGSGTLSCFTHHVDSAHGSQWRSLTWIGMVDGSSKADVAALSFARLAYLQCQAFTEEKPVTLWQRTWVRTSEKNHDNHRLGSTGSLVRVQVDHTGTEAVLQSAHTGSTGMVIGHGSRSMMELKSEAFRPTRSSLFSAPHRREGVEDSFEDQFRLFKGDWVVLGSSGLLQQVTGPQIAKVVGASAARTSERSGSSFGEEGTSCVHTTACQIVDLAYERSRGTCEKDPFVRQAGAGHPTVVPEDIACILLSLS